MRENGEKAYVVTVKYFQELTETPRENRRHVTRLVISEAKIGAYCGNGYGKTFGFTREMSFRSFSWIC